MEETAKLSPLGLLGEADFVPASLFTSHPEQARTLALLYDVSRELTAILDREELLGRIAQRVKKLVNYQIFSVMLWNEQTQLLESVFAMQCGDSIPPRLRLPLHQGVTGAAAGERRAMRVDDVQADPRYIKCEPGLNARSELVIPLLLQDRLIGVLDLESTEPGAFSADDERMLSTLGSYIAIALENARLFSDARVNEKRLRQDLDVAKEIQLQLLPKGAREVPGLDLAAGYEPARELGGDFYDFLPYGEGRLGLVLGDVSGKGTGAALYGSLAIGMLREHVVEHPCPPAEMLAMLNVRLNAVRLDARFIALIFAVYEASTRTLRIANAGAPYPLLIRDGTVEELHVAGVPLGLFPDSKYDEIEVALQPRDVVFFASDGILESFNAAGEEFGSERLAGALTAVGPAGDAAEIAASTLLATDRHAGAGMPPHDDRSLLVLRMTDEPSESDFSKMPIIY